MEPTVPEKLYDREHQTIALEEAYDRSCVASTSDREIVMIAGPSGVGKTALASHLKDRAAQDGGYFVSGKFDQLAAANSQATAQSYGAFFTALTELCRQVVAAGEEQMQSIKTHLEAELHSVEMSVLKDTLPALSLIYGEPSVDSKTYYDKMTTRGANAESSFVSTITKFVHSFCSEGQPPLVFLLDDIQWADSKSLSLFMALAAANKAPSSSKLVLLCTYRVDEVPGCDEFENCLRIIKESGVVVTRIDVPSLSEIVVNQMVANRLNVPLLECKQVADAIYRKTEGNVLFVVQLIQEAHLLTNGALGQGQWDNKQILQTIESQSVLELLVKKIRRLPDSTIEMLKIASCLGVAFSEAILCSVGTVAEADVAAGLRHAEDDGLIIFDFDLGSGRFTHDKIQQAAYTLIPEEDISLFHLNIGTKLAKRLSPSLLESHLLLVAGQITRGAPLLNNTEERVRYAELYLRAGIKAATQSAYTTAATFLRDGIDLLGPRCWRDNYSLSLNLYNTAAEIEYYNGNLETVDALVAVVFLRARRFDDALRAHFTHIYSLGTQNEMLKGLEEAFEVLKHLGETFPRKAGFLHVWGALMNCRRMLRRNRDVAILNLPVMRDKTKLAAMRLLLVVSVNVFFVRKEFLPLFCDHIVALTLQHGISNMCCVGFATLSLLFAIRGDVEHAYRTCKLALQTLQKYDAKEWQARVAVTVYGGIFSLKHPYRDSIEPLLDAHRSGLVLGDSYSSFTSALLYCRIALFRGIRISQLAKETRAFRDACRQRSLHVVLSTFDANLQLLQALMGTSPEAITFADASPNEEENLAQMKRANQVNYLTFLLFQTFFSVYMNNRTRTQELLIRMRQEQLVRMLPFTLYFHYFLEGLASARMSRFSWREKRHANRCLRKLRMYASHCPQNFQNKVYLVEAELAANAGRTDEALRKFQQSIDIASQEQLIHEQGLAFEGAGYALQHCGRFNEARDYFQQASTCYSSWGAQLKVDQLRDLIL